MAGPQQRLQAVDQGVLVGPVQGVPRLEGHHALPALGGQQRADLPRREHVLAETRMLRLRQHADRAAHQVRLAGVAHQDHVGAGMVGPPGPIDGPQVARLVPGKDVAEFERGHDPSGGVHQGRLLSALPKLRINNRAIRAKRHVCPHEAAMWSPYSRASS